MFGPSKGNPQPAPPSTSTCAIVGCSGTVASGSGTMGMCPSCASLYPNGGKA